MLISATIALDEAFSAHGFIGYKFKLLYSKPVFKDWL